MTKEWKYYDLVKENINKLEKEFNINKLLAVILSNRGIKEENIRKYLEPTRYDFYDPFQMPDMEKAVERIMEAVEKSERILIYGDYDVDGITSISVLKSFFKDRGIITQEYIPNRIYEGYGLNKEAIKSIAEKKIDLIITVDCGITAIDEIEYAKSLGMDVIVTDHHEPGNEIPSAIAVVDCKRKDNIYPFRELAGVGVAFKLCQALSKRLNLNEKEYLKYLDIVAIGTIADVVPLIDENRVIAMLGMKLLNITKNYGLRALINLSGYNIVNSNTVAFGIAPRINACGRMGYAYDALNLMFSNDMQEAIKNAKNIVEYNTKRQTFEKLIYEEALTQIEQNGMQKLNSIVLGGENWHHGVAGIVASRITELYYKPCILVCFENGEDIGKGSGRSIQGFDIYQGLTECKDLLESFGGHTMAIGLSVKKDNLIFLQEKFEQIASKSNIKNMVPVLNIDALINIDEITKEMVESLKLLEPIGEANQMPIFAFEKLRIANIRSLSEGKHIKITLCSNNNTYIDSIGFNLGYYINELKIGDMIDIAGSLEINSYNGMENIQINIKDLKKSEKVV